MIRPETYTAFDALRAAFDRARTIVLSTHLNPDGDGLGSELALKEYLTSKGKNVSILNNDPVPPSYSFLDPDGSHLRPFDADRDSSTLLGADTIVVVDTNHPDRLGGLSPIVTKSTALKVIIDHHPEPHSFASVVVADEQACATGELVFRYLEHVGALPFSPSTARALYTAIMTDTGSFRFPKTDGDVHRMIALLIDAGADPASTYDAIYDTGPVNRLRLLGRVLAGLELHRNGSLCTMTVTKAMFEETQTSEIDTDKFVTYALSIGGVTLGILFSELPGGIKINVRSRGSVPANAIAKAFGGNGHLNAAGARVQGGTLEDIVPKAIAAAASILNKD